MADTLFIKISDITVSDCQLKIKFDFSKELSKYFFKNSFEIFYDQNIENVDESILSIPAVLPIVPIAWACGAELFVDKLDESCFGSLKNLRKVYSNYFPKFSLSGDIHVQKIISNRFNNKRNSLLFSGGLDSVISYIKNRDKNPILITLLRTSDDPRNFEYHNEIKNLHKKFAEGEEKEIHFIESKMWTGHSDTINNNLLGKDFETKNWQENVSHGLIMLGLCAPLTVEKIGNIALASTYSHNSGHNIPHGSHWLAENDVSWGDIHATYDGSNLTRQDKIRVLKKYPKYQQYLRVCFSSNVLGTELKNCGNCEKCLRTITGLILEETNPNKCNFDVKNDVLDELKKLLLRGNFSIGDINYWHDIQNHIPNVINDNEITRRFNSKQFFEWFSDFNLSEYKFIIHKPSIQKKLLRSLRKNGIVWTCKAGIGYLRTK